MAPPKQPAPVIVSTGVLTQAEFDAASPAIQASIEADAQRLLAQYGPAWLTEHRDRLRDELAFAHGI